ncbi:hypothetical protein FNL39_103328 [Nocardia caishijiensis]|uniref:Uncharacterized protein n=2 Tax=Nocardia caishijiensis TaxID=184756 RepID=A0ABQ6YPE2_9NOCA|nr:hypothetical protein FNL39_103328 [Nocardia caishijiensis]
MRTVPLSLAASPPRPVLRRLGAPRRPVLLLYPTVLSAQMVHLSLDVSPLLQTLRRLGALPVRVVLLSLVWLRARQVSAV